MTISLKHEEHPQMPPMTFFEWMASHGDRWVVLIAKVSMVLLIILALSGLVEPSFPRLMRIVRIVCYPAVGSAIALCGAVSARVMVMRK